MYNQSPYGMGLVPPILTEGKGKYTANPIVILGGSGSFGQNSKLHSRRKGNGSCGLNHDSAIQLSKLSGFSPITLHLSSTPSTLKLLALHTLLVVTFPTML